MKLSLLLSQMGVEMLAELKFNRDMIDNYYARGYNQALDEISNLEVPEQKVLSIDEMAEHTIPLVEEFFPKGECQERGQAIVLHAKMLIVIHDTMTGKGK